MHPLIVLLATITPGFSQAQLPDSLPGKRLAEFITAFNTKSVKQVEAMVGRSFSKSALKDKNAADWANTIANAFPMAPISVSSILKETPNMIAVRLKANERLPVGMRLDLEDEIPFGIVSARMGNPKDLVATSAPSKYEKWTDLSALATQIQKDYKLPALAIGYQVNGQKLQQAYSGVRSTQENDVVDSTDRFVAGDIGKAMTAMLLARMIDLKKLSWTMTLENALPGLSMNAAYKKITLEDLLHHKGGIPQTSRLDAAAVEKLAATAQSASDLRKAYVQDVLSIEPTEAGSSAQTTDSDYIIAGYIVERLIGKPYEYLMQRYVFEPLKMSSVLIAPIGTDGQAGSTNNVFGHLQSDGGFVPSQLPPSRTDIMRAPAGVCTSCTLEDFVTFGMANLTGIKGTGPLLSADSYKRLHSGPKNSSGWIISPDFVNDECRAISGTTGTFTYDLEIWPGTNLVTVAFSNTGASKQPSATLQATLAIQSRIATKE